mgnify:CR=1 FL=1
MTFDVLSKFVFSLISLFEALGTSLAGVESGDDPAMVALPFSPIVKANLNSCAVSQWLPIFPSIATDKGDEDIGGELFKVILDDE